MANLRYKTRFGAAVQRAAGSIVLMAMLLGGCGRDEKIVSAAELLEQGWSNFRLRDFPQAIKCFSRAAELAPTGADAAALQAFYGLGVAHSLSQQADSLELARVNFEEVVRRAPDSEQAAWSLLGLARAIDIAGTPVVTIDAPSIASDQEPVRRAYQRVIDQFPGHVVALEALILQQSTLVASLDADDAKRAIATLEKFAADRPRGPFAGPAYDLLAQAYKTLRDPENQVRVRRLAIELREPNPSHPNPDHSGAYWALASIAEFEAGDFAVAREYYRRLLLEYPNDFRAFNAQLALERMDKTEARLRASAQAQAETAGGRP